MSKLSRNQIIELRNFAKNHSQDGLYHMLHETRVARDATKLAKILGADPEVCWVAGLTHDLGYSLPGHHNEHRERSYELVVAYLQSLGLPYNFIKDVGSAILNHDQKLTPSEHPLEDLIVCQVDAGSFFKYYKGLAIWLYHMRIREGDPSQRINLVREAMVSHANETLSYLTYSPIRERYEQDIERFTERVGGLDVSKLIDNGARSN